MHEQFEFKTEVEQPEVIRASWPLDKVVAFTTTTDGGTSTGAYASNNLAYHVGDDPQSVTKNWTQLKSALQLQSWPLYMQQVHSGICLVIKRPVFVNNLMSSSLIPNDLLSGIGSNEPQSSSESSFTADGILDRFKGLMPADAQYTQLPGQMCMVLTADCVPVLIADAQQTEVMAIHAGWQGILNSVIENSIAKSQLKKQPKLSSAEASRGEDKSEPTSASTIDPLNGKNYDTSQPNRLLAWIGPCIQKQSFEVGEELVEKFVAYNPEFKAYFTPSETAKGKWYGDLVAVVKHILVDQGLALEDIYSADLDTFSSDKFFSYRRDKVTGRVASIIYLKS